VGAVLYQALPLLISNFFLCIIFAHARKEEKERESQRTRLSSQEYYDTGIIIHSQYCDTHRMSPIYMDNES
jgi:3-deoxy-D-manno-octulosonic-acid transferase